MREKLTGIWFRYIVPIEAVALFIGAVLHLGVSAVGITEARVIPATVVESTIGAGLAVAAFVYYRRRDSWPVVMVEAHLLALTGVLLGVAATHLRDGQNDSSNDIFHIILLASLGIGLVLASLAGGVFGTSDEAQRA